MRRAQLLRQAFTFSAVALIALSGCGDPEDTPNASPQAVPGNSQIVEQATNGESEINIGDREIESEMKPVTSAELKGIWMGVAEETAVVLRFIGRESRQREGGVVEGEWLVDVPGHAIGSGLEFIDDAAAGVVELEVGLWSIETGESFRSSLGRVERGVSGQLYLSIYENETQPAYPKVNRIPLEHIGDHSKIEKEDIDRALAARKRPGAD